MADRQAIIVGGGVIGTACAYYLAKSDWRVTVIDQGKHGMLCSHANCGLVSPSHVLPLTVPGAITENIKLMLQKNSPFYIKPRFDPKLWGWLARFALRCRHKPMVQAGHARHALLQSSRSLYDQLMNDECLEAEFQEEGCLFVYQTARAFDAFEEENELTRTEYGVAATKLNAEQLQEMEPALKPGLAGAWFFETDAHLRPDRLMTSWRGALERLGVTIVEDCKLLGFQRRDRTALGVKTSTGEFSADNIVVATGALTPLLYAQLDCNIPIQPGKGYSITMPRPTRCPRWLQAKWPRTGPLRYC